MSEILYELGLDVTHEDLINQVIDSSHLEDIEFREKILGIVVDNISVDLLETFSEEIEVLKNLLLNIKQETTKALSIVFKNKPLYSRYINWTTGDLIISSERIKDEYVRSFCEICSN